MKLNVLANDSMKTGIARLCFEKVEYIRENGKLVNSIRREITLFLVTYRAYALSLSNLELMESIRKNVNAAKHIAADVEVLAFRDENEARAAAKSL